MALLDEWKRIAKVAPVEEGTKMRAVLDTRATFGDMMQPVWQSVLSQVGSSLPKNIKVSRMEVNPKDGKLSLYIGGEGQKGMVSIGVDRRGRAEAWVTLNDDNAFRIGSKPSDTMVKFAKAVSKHIEGSIKPAKE